MRLFAGTEFDIPPRCERCGELEENCECQPAPPPRIAPEKQTARIAVEKRAKGKIATVVRGLSEPASDLPALLAELKTACGAGGTLKEDTLEIQGDHLARIRERLTAIGYRVPG